MRQELISRCYNNPLAGHFGAAKTYKLLARKYYWDGSLKEVTEYYQLYDICQRTKAPRHRPYSGLGLLPIASQPWQEISIDFVTGLPPSKYKGLVYNAILIIVDRFTKIVRYLPISTTIDAAALAELFYTEIVYRYGMPKGIVSNRGSIFTSAF